MINKFFKSYIKKVVFTFVYILSASFLVFFKLLNSVRKKERVLIFTDSRGFEVTRPWNRKSALSSYIRKLVIQYNCDVVICPEKHTSLLDFVCLFHEKKRNYSFVVLHCGIVDFAPRPLSSFNEILRAKKSIIKKYKLNKFFLMENKTLGPEYLQEATVSFMNKEILQDFVIPNLKLIDNLIYIGVNRVLSDWNGKYWRGRPSNINEQMILDKMILQEIRCSIDLSYFSDSEIKKYTSDNVHYTKSGFDLIYQEVTNAMRVECLKN